MIRPLTFLCLLTLTRLASANSAEFMHCYDFGCKSVAPVNYSEQQWQALAEIFSRPALSAWLEKQQIREAIALMERFSGALAGTDQDKAGNYPGEEIPGQQDCIDESTNTMQYLAALEQRNWLQWHKVEGKQRRTTLLIFMHWTAVIRELPSNELYAVDSWYRDNGEKPFVQRLADWQYRDEFPISLNP